MVTSRAQKLSRPQAGSPQAVTGRKASRIGKQKRRKEHENEGKRREEGKRERRLREKVPTGLNVPAGFLGLDAMDERLTWMNCAMTSGASRNTSGKAVTLRRAILVMNASLLCRNGRPIANEGQTRFSWLLGPDIPSEHPALFLSQLSFLEAFSNNSPSS